MGSEHSGVFLVLGQVAWLNAVLSIDNAILIGLAARSLPRDRRMQAMIFIAGALVIVRVALTFAATWLLTLPYFQLLGGLLLLWVGVQLMDETAEGGESLQEGFDGLLNAVRAILIADLVTSLDNVIVVAAAAKGDFVPLLLGLTVSIPLVVFGGTLMIKVMNRVPAVISLGAALIGWLAGDAISRDVADLWGTTPSAFFGANPLLSYALKSGCAVLVVAVGWWIARRRGPSAG